jgi:HAD superfamily hydrolase (TIGR01484 family)
MHCVLHETARRMSWNMLCHRLIALDLDGTLLTDDKRIADSTKLWVGKAADAGVIVTFATGRGRQDALSFVRELDLDSPMVFLNGAEIWGGPGQLLERHFMDTEDIYRLHQLTAETGCCFWGYTVETLIQNDWSNDMLHQEWMKYGMYCDDVDLMAQLRDYVDSWGTVEVTCTSDANMEVTARGITKARGVRRICEQIGIEMEAVMAVGDGLNDLDLIEGAGLGVAMGNAAEELKRAADFVTESNEDDGVVLAIRRCIFGM